MSKYGYGSATHSIGTVETDSGTIVTANANREYLLIQNDDNSTVIYLGFGGAAVANQGIRLSGAGSVGCSYEMTKGAGNLYTGEIQAIVGSGSVNPIITEGT